MCTIQQIESDPRQEEQVCASVVDTLLACHEWQLLKRDDFIRQTLEYLHVAVSNDPQRAAVHAYSQALYRSCSGAMGPEQQNIAYTELFHYLYDIAQRRYPRICEDATQRALMRIFTVFANCREPGAFLAFALQHLMDAARTVRRQEGHHLGSLSTFADLDHNNHGEVLRDRRVVDPLDEVLTSELRSRLEELTIAFLQKHPRAALQFAALRLKFIEGFDEVTISQRLGKPVNSIYVLRSRAIEKLREEPEWRALASELGLLEE